MDRLSTKPKHLTLLGEKDQLFQKKIYPKPFAFNEQVASCFDDMVSRSVPLYKEVNQSILEWAYLLNFNHPKIYDLGCSTGTTLMHIAGALAGNCSLIGIDASKAMIEKAYSKLTSLNQPSYDIQFECRELQNVVLNDAAMVILNYTLQFIKVLDRPLILKKIFDGLKPQGILYLSEKIKFKDPVFQENATFIYENFKEQAGYSKIEIARKKEALENVLVPFSLPEILQMLHECGFASAEPIMQWNNFVSIIARKK